jgi:hypothetical protein
MTKGGFDRVWFWKKWLGSRKGQECRILARGLSMNTCLVEFRDGYQVVTSRYAVRLIRPVIKGKIDAFKD